MCDELKHVPCPGGQHTVEKIGTTYISIERNEYRIVQWCTACGALRFEDHTGEEPFVSAWEYPEMFSVQRGTEHRHACGHHGRRVVNVLYHQLERNYARQTCWCRVCGAAWAEDYNVDSNGALFGQPFWEGDYKNPTDGGPRIEGNEMEERSERPIQHHDLCTGTLMELTRYTWAHEHHVIRWCNNCGGFAITKEVRGELDTFVLHPRYSQMAFRASRTAKGPNWQAITERIMANIFHLGADRNTPPEAWPEQVAEAWKTLVDAATPKSTERTGTKTYNALRDIVTNITGGIPSVTVDMWPGVVKRYWQDMAQARSVLEEIMRGFLGVVPEEPQTRWPELLTEHRRNWARAQYSGTQAREALENIFTQVMGKVPTEPLSQWPSLLNDYLWKLGMKPEPEAGNPQPMTRKEHPHAPDGQKVAWQALEDLMAGCVSVSMQKEARASVAKVQCALEEQENAITVQLRYYAELHNEVTALRKLRDELQAANSNYVAGIRAGESLARVLQENAAAADRGNLILLREIGRLTELLAGFGYREGTDGTPSK